MALPPLTSARVLPEEEVFRLADLVSELLLPQFRDAFIRAIRKTSAGTDTSALAAALERQDVEGALAAVPWAVLSEELGPLYSGASPLLLSSMRSGAEIGTRLLPQFARVDSFTSFDVIQPRAVAWLEQHGAENIADLTLESRAGLRRLLISAFDEPLSIRETVRGFREILGAPQVQGLVGVTSGQAEQLTEKMLAYAEDPDLSVDQIQGLVNRDHRRMISRRAEVEAQTEIKTAGNEAQMQVWENAVDLGKINIRGLRENFAGDQFEGKGEKRQDFAERPPLHMSCFCQLRAVTLSPGVYGIEWVTRIRGVCPRCQRMDGKIAGQ